MYSHASPNHLFGAVSPCEWTKQVRPSVMNSNPLDKINGNISNFEGSHSPTHFKDKNQPEDVETPKLNDLQASQTQNDDDAYIANFDSFDDTSSIQSAIAVEVSSEFVRNDYLSKKYEDEHSLANQPKLVQFYDQHAQYMRHESPRRISEAMKYMPMVNPIQHHPMQQIAPSFMPFPSRKEVPAKIIKCQGSPVNKPTFSGSELVSSFKRQKLTDLENPQQSQEVRTKMVSYSYFWIRAFQIFSAQMIFRSLWPIS